MTLPERLPVRPLLVNTVLTVLAMSVALHLDATHDRNRDDLVLALSAVHVSWLVVRLLRGTDRAAARPWRWLLVAATLLALACLGTGSGMTRELGTLGVPDLLLIGAAVCPLVTCVLLAAATGRTAGRLVLALDGAVLLGTVLVIGEVHVLTPALRPEAVTDALAPLVVVYGCYAAVAIGLPSAVLIATRVELRAAASLLTLMVALQGVAGISLAMSVDESSPTWELTANLTLSLSMLVGVAAVAVAPRSLPPRGQHQHLAVGRLELTVTVLALAGLPVDVVVMRLQGQTLSTTATVGTAVVMLLLVLRTAGRIVHGQRLSRDLVATEEDVRDLVEASSDGVVIIDGDLALVSVSPVARAVLGLPPGPLPAAGFPSLVHEEDRALVQLQLCAALVPEAGPLLFRVQLAGGVREVETTITERLHSPRRVLHLRDVTDRLSRERELEQLAFTDHLTQLPNRAMLFRELSRDAGDGARSLLVVDLDGFKAVNDVAGHEAGDHLLIEVGRRLRNVVRDGDLVARLGGDEFAVLVAGGLAEAIDIAQRVVVTLTHPHRTGGWAFGVGASVGASTMLPGGGQLAFRQADAALRAAKQAGKGCLRVWTDDGVTSVAADSDLVAALVDGQVQLRLDVDGDGHGGTAVLHASPVWVHPVAGTLPAVEVWAAAERQGRATELSTWLLARACTEIADWAPGVLLALDLTAAQAHSADLAGDVLSALSVAGLSPRRLVLALTEETALTAPASFGPALVRLRDAGVQLALDEFGLGQTLFAHLDRLPLTAVRVDLSAFVRQGRPDLAPQVLASIVSTAHAFGLLAVAAGVDGPEQLAMARAAGVDAFGGRAFPQGLTVASARALIGQRLPSPTP
ncbi:EAL domain-containing protein [Modestobacter sp. I12A-02628]|uniref:EAL domain-containing protein n=1 Tax=Goekera deserti TaxID=2497753 RepID=A0A7K3WFB4_9ACTN|nr:EAL domain-containing protein [Goekera deserti]MPQ97883.1 EAL domain-containing protein [Goekera deserti]NDI48529.1 EAL domain-containing protein [Goekera deserti]NEL55092.1 EAL domain-containing protein [Goekera deserti]